MARTPVLLLAMVAAMLAVLAARARPGEPPLPLVTGRFLAHLEGVGVGSFPAQMALSPDGRWIAVVSVGRRQALTILDAAKGTRVSSAAPDARSAYYAGLAWGRDGALYVSEGASNRVAVYRVDAQGQLTAGGAIAIPPQQGSGFVAGLALSADGTRLYAVQNECSPASGWHGALSTVDLATGRATATVPTVAFPYALCAGDAVYTASERDGTVVAIRGDTRKTIPTGTNPMALLLDPARHRLYVANAGSDTVSIIDTDHDRVEETLSLRPSIIRAIPGLTPSGLALDGDRLYVTLADFNALAVVDVSKHPRLLGMVPTGWYPTAVVAAHGAVYVANAKGTSVRTPNAHDVGSWGHHPLGILEGSVSRLEIGPDLEASTRLVLADARAEIPKRDGPPRIGHVIYVIKENRTYDQVLGDVSKGNGDARLVLFGREVTPNQHALAERFVLLDNFYCCAEVSADGWNWTTGGMTSEYTARNVPYYYSHKGRHYDFEGSTNDVPVDLQKLPDVARPPAGYLWDLCLAHGVDFRNFGFFITFTDDEGVRHAAPDRNEPSKRALEGRTDASYRRFDLDYADSDAWRLLGFKAPQQLESFGAHRAPSRISEFRNEFDAWCRDGKMPRLVMLRLPRDHTAGTRRQKAAPRAMVADNDYAVGQLVDMVSHSRFWKDCVIFIVEDDAQSGQDHVDCHRSTCYVVSPWVRAGRVDSRFYNSDSVLRTMEQTLGLPPMCQYDALAPPLDVFGSGPADTAPYRAILPDRAILTELNGDHAYRADDCEAFDWREADRVPDEALNDILWHAVKGSEIALPFAPPLAADDD